MNQVEAQKKWYKCQSQTPLNEVLSLPIPKAKKFTTLANRDVVAKADARFLLREIEVKPVGPVVIRGYLNAVYRVSHVLRKAARVRTNAMENQDHVDRRGLPKTPVMRLVVAILLP